MTESMESAKKWSEILNHYVAGGEVEVRYCGSWNEPADTEDLTCFDLEDIRIKESEND